jgi:predicted branched-subunit amino acid permease
VSVRASVCPYCEAALYEDEVDDRPRKKQSGDVEAVDFLIPTNVSGWSIASCYMGLIGLCLPFVGLLFSIPALIFGIIALKKRRRATSYGAVTSDIRAIVGIVLSTLSIVLYTTLFILIATGALK